MNDAGRTLNGETDFVLDSIDIVGSGIGVDGDFGDALQFIGKDSNNNLSYVNNPIENAAGNHLVYDSANKKINFDTDTDLTLDAQLTVNNTLKATAGLRAPLSQSSADHGLFKLASGFMDIYHDAEEGEHIKKFFEVRVHNNISPHQFTVYKIDGNHPIFQLNCDDPDFNTEATIKIGASITFHEDNAYQLGSYDKRFQVIYSNNLIAGNTLIKLLEFDTHGDTFVFNPLTSTTDTMVSLNTIVQIGNPYLWRPMVAPNYKLDHTCFNIYVHKTNTDSIGQYSNTVNLERQGATKNEIKLLNHLIPDGNINLGSIFNSYINIYSNSFTGNLIGNANTATKIDTITNDDIVLKDSIQTLTNKTISGSFTGDLTGSATSATTSTTSTNAEGLSSTTDIFINQRLIPTSDSTIDIGQAYRSPMAPGGSQPQVQYRTLYVENIHFSNLNTSVNCNANDFTDMEHLKPWADNVGDIGEKNGVQGYTRDLRWRHMFARNLYADDLFHCSASDINFSGLGTFDPQIQGRLWKDSTGTLKVSSGN
mgnify:CR=1 FL=1